MFKPVYEDNVSYLVYDNLTGWHLYHTDHQIRGAWDDIMAAREPGATPTKFRNVLTATTQDIVTTLFSVWREQQTRAQAIFRLREDPADLRNATDEDVYAHIASLITFPRVFALLELRFPLGDSCMAWATEKALIRSEKVHAEIMDFGGDDWAVNERITPHLMPTQRRCFVHLSFHLETTAADARTCRKAYMDMLVARYKLKQRSDGPDARTIVEGYEVTVS